MADLFPKLRTPKNVVRYLSKKSRFKEPFDRQLANVFKRCCNLNHKTVTIFSDHFEGN